MDEKQNLTDEQKIKISELYANFNKQEYPREKRKEAMEKFHRNRSIMYQFRIMIKVLLLCLCMVAVTTWYALEYMPHCFKYFMPISSDGWSLGRFAGMTHPTETAEHFANTIRSSTLSKNNFYIWACSGTDDVAYDRIWLQVQAMAQFTDVFSVSNLTFHEQDGARHEFHSLAEYLYNALPFMFQN